MISCNYSHLFTRWYNCNRNA